MSDRTTIASMPSTSSTLKSKSPKRSLKGPIIRLMTTKTKIMKDFRRETKAWRGQSMIGMTSCVARTRGTRVTWTLVRLSWRTSRWRMNKRQKCADFASWTIWWTKSANAKVNKKVKTSCLKRNSLRMHLIKRRALQLHRWSTLLSWWVQLWKSMQSTNQDPLRYSRQRSPIKSY